MKLPFFAFTALFPFLLAAQDKSGLHVTDTFHIRSDGGWDYIAVDHDLNRLYVSHGTQVNILNETTGDSVGIIPNTTGVHGIAFAPAFGKGYTSNGKLGTVTVFDLKTNSVLKQVHVGENPDAIMFDDYSKRIYTCNGHSHDMSIIDPQKDTLVGTIPLGGKPETAVSDGNGKLFVNIEDKSEIAVIDLAKDSVIARWKTGSGEEPSGLAIDRKNGILFSGCSNKLMIVMDCKTGNVIAELPIGDGCDGTAFDPGTMNAFSSNGDGTLTVIHEDSPKKFTVTGNVATKRGARTLCVDLQTHKIYLPTAQLGDTPPATADNPRPRPKKIPGTFQVIVVGK
ncbi:MAG TPA: YncE family protein [Bacteroidia bacterium]|nr:YncE family protein [Bacteroidia bacterium]